MTTAVGEKKPEDKLELRTLFCDDSTDIREYDYTIIGQMNATSDLKKVQTMGAENDTVFSKYPHVVDVKFCYYHDGELERMAEYPYFCPCKKKEEATG